MRRTICLAIAVVFFLAISLQPNYFAASIETHNISVISLDLQKDAVGQGFPLFFQVTLNNTGTVDETINLTASINATVIERVQDITLLSGESKNVTLHWDTVGWLKGNYAMDVRVEPIEGETDVSDNNLTFNKISITFAGDTNRDGCIDIYDALTLALAFNTKPDKPNWNAYSDINGDNAVDIFDAIVLANNFGKPLIETIAKGLLSNYISRAFYVINNLGDWTSIWNLHQGTSTPEQPPPEVNFSESMVIAVFMGQRNTGGYKIEIERIMCKDSSLVVKVVETMPGYNCFVVQILTQPYHFVKIEKTNQQVTFETTLRITNCG